MTFEVRISDDFMIDGVAIYIAIKDGPGSRRLLRLHEDGSQEWKEIAPLTTTEPTLKIPGEAAQALLDSLLRHYQGASDMHTVRADLLNERNRVDKLSSALMQIAIHATGSAWRGSTPPDSQR
jgi:hypothetical protein